MALSRIAAFVVALLVIAANSCSYAWRGEVGRPLLLPLPQLEARRMTSEVAEDEADVDMSDNDILVGLDEDQQEEWAPWLPLPAKRTHTIGFLCPSHEVWSHSLGRCVRGSQSHGNDDHLSYIAMKFV